jgi:hypothetical protein
LSLVKDIVKYVHKKLKDTMSRPEIQDAPMGTPINLRLGITSLGVVLDFIHIYDVHPLAAHEPSAFVHDLGVLIAKAKMKNAEENDVELPKLSSKIPVLCFKTIKEGKKIGAENHWCISVIDRYWTSFLNKSHMLYMVPYKERLILVYQTKDGVVAEAKYPFNESLSAPVMNVVKKIAKDVKFV